MAKHTEWAPPRRKWPPGCTPTRDGWVRWYRGRTRHVCGRKTPLQDVPGKWKAVRKRIDDEADVVGVLVTTQTYRDVLSEFLVDCETRVRTGLPKPMAARTFHNYTVELNKFGQHVGGLTPFSDTNSPEIFTAYRARYDAYSRTAFDSIVTRVGSLYRWAVQMEYIERWRHGPMFRRPPKAEIRSERISLTKSMSATRIARLYLRGNRLMRCAIGLGLCCGFTNSDVAHLPRDCVDLNAGIIDFRRRKSGKVRRVCVLPEHVADDLRGYKRPEPASREYNDRFFLTVKGRPYAGSQKDGGKPSDSLGRLWNKLRKSVGDGDAKFTGLRTTLFNEWPADRFEVERKIVMGRAQGNIDLDSYMEKIGLDRIRAGVNHVWNPISIALADEAARLALAGVWDVTAQQPSAKAPHARSHATGP